MGKVTIRLAESAVSELRDIGVWYAAQHVPEVGQRLIAEIVARIEALAIHPKMGRVVPEFGQPFLRELLHPPFRIVYRCDTGLIRVVRVWRSERQLQLEDEQRA